MSSVTNTFPPKATLAGILVASSSSVLAAKAFADPNSGYAEGLQSTNALYGRSEGNFNLSSGVISASNAIEFALSEVKDFQSAVSDIYSAVSRLRNPALTKDAEELARRELSDLLQNVRERFQKDELREYNLLNPAQAAGISLDLRSGAVTNISNTASTPDKRFSFSPDSLSLQALDIPAVLDDLDRVIAQSYAGSSDNVSSDGGLATVNRVQTTLVRVTETLKGYKKDLTAAATDRLNGVFDTGSAPLGSEDARQIASRLALALNNDSFGISGGQPSRFFSLFA